MSGSVTSPPPAPADPWATAAGVPQPEAALEPGPRRDRPRRRWALRWAPAGVVAVGASAIALTTAAAAGVLPAPAQRVMASVVRTVTPFEVPEPSSGAAPRPAAPSTPTTAENGSGGAAPGSAAGGTTAGSTPGATAPRPAATSPQPSSNGPSSGPAAGNGAPGATAPGHPPETAQPPAPPGQVKPDLTATLTGTAVVPKEGDRDGAGAAAVTLDPGRAQLCLQLSLAGVSPATSVHVHAAGKGKTGPVVATFVPPLAAAGTSCVAVDRDVLSQLRAHPSDFYVDVHNADFPDGALRGQLEKA
jgi:hypothetical protein